MDRKLENDIVRRTPASNTGFASGGLTCKLVAFHGVKLGALILTAKLKNIIFVNLLGYGMDFSIYSYTLHYGTTDVKY